jgi:hypothetical protein
MHKTALDRTPLCCLVVSPSMKRNRHLRMIRKMKANVIHLHLSRHYLQTIPSTKAKWTA